MNIRAEPASADASEAETEQTIGREVAELANLAADLTRSVVEKQQHQLAESEHTQRRDAGTNG